MRKLLLSLLLVTPIATAYSNIVPQNQQGAPEGFQWVISPSHAPRAAYGSGIVKPPQRKLVKIPGYVFNDERDSMTEMVALANTLNRKPRVKTGPDSPQVNPNKPSTPPPDRNPQQPQAPAPQEQADPAKGPEPGLQSSLDTQPSKSAAVQSHANPVAAQSHSNPVVEPSNSKPVVAPSNSKPVVAQSKPNLPTSVTPLPNEDLFRQKFRHTLAIAREYAKKQPSENKDLLQSIVAAEDYLNTIPVKELTTVQLMTAQLHRDALIALLPPDWVEAEVHTN